MRKRTLAVLLVLLMLLGLVGCAVPTADQGSESPLPCPEDGTPLTEEQLQEFDAMFAADTWYGRTLTSIYEKPGDVDMRDMFRENPKLSTDYKLSDLERAALLQAGCDEEILDNLPCDRVTRQEMEAALQQCFGRELYKFGQTNLEKLLYLEETDAWYYFHGDTNMVVPEFLGGYSQPDGRTVVLYYEWSDAYRVVTLYLTQAGDWHVLSHLPLSPVGAAPGPAYA